MFPSRRSNPAQRRLPYCKDQQGVGLPLALFVVVIMGLLAAQASQISERSSVTSVHAVSSARAFYAAEAGAHQAVTEALSISPCQCPYSSQSYVFNVEGLMGCEASVSCEVWTVESESLCVIGSRGQCDGGNASRAVEVRLR